MAERLRRLLNAAVNRHRAIVERMRHGNLGLDPLQAVVGQIQAGEERGRLAEGKDRRTHVVAKRRERKFVRPGAATDRISALDKQNPILVPCQFYCCRQAIRAGANHNSVVINHRAIQADG